MSGSSEPAVNAPRGDCGEAAVHHVMEHPTGIVCHGYPIGQGPIAGIKHWHAWVETPAGFVIDKSNGKNTYMPRELYYAIGQIEEDEVLRFDHDEMVKKIFEFKHYGPWDGTEPPYESFDESDEDEEEFWI